MPSVEVAALVELLLELNATATKVLFPKVTPYQPPAGSVRCVQVMPSVEVAAVVEFWFGL